MKPRRASKLGASKLGANVRRMNADPKMRARISAACSEGMKRWWESRRLPAMTPHQRWKYRQIREALGREAALRVVLS